MAILRRVPTKWTFAVLIPLSLVAFWINILYGEVPTQPMSVYRIDLSRRTNVSRNGPPSPIPLVSTLTPKVPVPSISESDYYKMRGTIVNPHDYACTVCPRCTGKDEKPFLVIAVLSVHTDRANRDAIRKTWGSVASTKLWAKKPFHWRIKVMFLIATYENTTINKLVAEEANKTNDIIQEDFVDSYKNLTLKSIMALKWITYRCPKAQFLMKTDTDMFVNVKKLTDFLLKTKLVDFDKTLVGHLNGLYSPVFRTGLWGVPVSQYPFQRYPKYLAGNGYVMSSTIAKRLYNISLYVPRVDVEDVYITGILTKIGKMSLHMNSDFVNWNNRLPGGKCYQDAITITRVKPDRMRELWRKLVEGEKC